MENIFASCESKYAIKTKLKHELSKHGMIRPGWDFESERSHFEENGDYEIVGVYNDAIARMEEIK